MIFIIIIFFTFKSYWDIPKNIDLYQIIDNDEYQALLFLLALPKSTVMAPSRISTALYATSRHEPVGTYFFYGDRSACELFFSSEDCRERQEILDRYEVKYVLSESKIDCGWDLIYDKKDYIYKVR
ncbi:unnamed protein product [marine sediment metagenome]|uniref:Uncharacterized protein n=1 Tax=marine sediment metagenome TaxID=412755 RepID=X1M5H6_9ZZZZ